MTRRRDDFEAGKELLRQRDTRTPEERKAEAAAAAKFVRRRVVEERVAEVLDALGLGDE